MSYYSEVAIAMRIEDYELLKDFDKENKNLRDLLEIADKKEYYGAISLKWNFLEWNPEFSEVQAIKEFLGKLSDEDKPYKFIRIGREWDDTEVEYSYGDEEKYEEIPYVIDDMIVLERDIGNYID